MQRPPLQPRRPCLPARARHPAGSPTHQGHSDEVLLGIHQRALDRGAHLAPALAADAHLACAVAHHHHRTKAHDLAALHHLGDARQLEHTLHKGLVALLLVGVAEHADACGGDEWRAHTR